MTTNQDALDDALFFLIDQIRVACINPATWSELGEKLRSLESAQDAGEFADMWIEAIQVLGGEK